ncbi:MAG: hypothetical protein JXP37_07695, partial [Coriobacteriia bacterium]|nr:hypothetical protein [Coriobacteriia bacterium]
SHENDSDVHLATAQGGVVLSDPLSGVSITCGSCHLTEISAEHGRAHVGLGDDACIECHNASERTTRAVTDSWPGRQGRDACEACHDDIHAGQTTVHKATQIDENGAASDTACVASGCHATADTRVLHAGLGCTLSGCHSKTGAISGTKMTCGGSDSESGTNCHTDGERHAALDAAHIATQIGHDGSASATGCARPGCHPTADVRVLHTETGGCATAGCHTENGPTYMTCGGAAGALACHTASDANKHDDFAVVHIGIEYSTSNVATPGSCVKDGCHLSVNVYETHHDAGCAISGCHVEGGPSGVLGCGGTDPALSCHLRNISYHTENPDHHIAVEYNDSNVPTPGTCVTAGCHSSTRMTTLHPSVKDPVTGETISGGCYLTAGCHVEGGPSMVIGCGGTDPTLSCHMRADLHAVDATAHLATEYASRLYTPPDVPAEPGACTDAGCHSTVDVRDLHAPVGCF